MNHTDQRLLMQLYDGELPPVQAIAMRRRLSQDVELRGVYAGLQQVGAVVRAVADRHASMTC